MTLPLIWAALALGCILLDRHRNPPTPPQGAPIVSPR